MGYVRLVGRGIRRITGAWLLAGGLVAAVVASPLLVLAQEGTEVPQEEPPTQMPESPTPFWPSPTAELPTPIPPSPTPVRPSTVMLETLVPTAQESTVEATADTPAPTLGAATEAPPTSTPTPEPLPNTDTLAATTASGPFSLGPGGEQDLTYTYSVTTPRTGTGIHVEVRNSAGAIATAWWLSGQAGGSGWVASGGAMDLVEYESLSPGASFSVTLIITAPAEVTTQENVTLHVSSTATRSDGDMEAAIDDSAPAASLTALPDAASHVEAPEVIDNELPTTGDVQLSCTPDSVLARVGGDPSGVSCSFIGSDTLGERVVTLVQIEVTAPPGWTVSAEGGASGGAVTLPIGATIGAGSVHEFDFMLIPDGCDAATGTVSVDTSLAFGGPEPFAGPSVELGTAISPQPPQSLTVDAGPLEFGTAPWAGGGYDPLTGSLTLTIDGAGEAACASAPGAWVIQASTDGLYHAETGDHLPADAILYLGAPSRGAPPGELLAVAADIPLGSEPVTIAHLSGAERADGMWTVWFSLDPPNGMPPGEYSGTITITVVNVSQAGGG